MSFNIINYQIETIDTVQEDLEEDLEEDHEEDQEEDLVKQDNNLIFSRIDSNMMSVCNFCKKFASYHDMENKNYCWFHRLQYE